MLYWFLPILIFVFQAIYTKASANQIRLEEVIETFRSVWWFQNHLVWNGSYSSLGWYTSLVAVYNLFGASFYSPKFVKLALELVSYFCLAAVLKKYLTVKRAWLPLATIGLSPTLMYFNSLSLAHGLEVSYFFICLYLISASQILVGATAMFGWLTYSSFIFYLPLLLVGYFYRRSKNLLACFVGFLIPLVLSVIYIKNRELLIHDTLLGGGLFRSFGRVEMAPDVWFSNLRIIWRDLFVAPTSYYFEAFRVEFSDFYPILGMVAVVLGLVMMIRRGKLPRLILFLVATLVFYFLLISLVGPKTLGGIRRGTVLLVIFYGLLAIVWDWTIRQKRSNMKYLIILGCSLILFHHLIVYPVNLGHIREESAFRERWWFNREQPESIMTDLISRVTKADLVLSCVDASGKPVLCPGLSLIYPAVEGVCYWNNLHCHQITVFDPERGQYLPVDMSWWGSGSHAEP